MTAAQALERDAAQKMFAFASYETGKAEPAQPWKDKHVTPILYNDANSHRNLHRTLHLWASVYRDGVRGKERIVVRHAHRLPKDNEPHNDFIGRVLWALSDKSGLPAKRFADFNPAPSLDWLLEPFSKARFDYGDLTRFGVPSHNSSDDKLRFSLIRRPAPYDRAPPMLLASGGITDFQWDDVMVHLVRWLLRHLDDPRLILWIVEHGGQLHDRWRLFIADKLNDYASLERTGKTAELDEIRRQSPNAIPRPHMRTLWRLLLSGRVKSPFSNHDLFLWVRRFELERLNFSLRMELREFLSPKVILKKPVPWWNDNDSSSTSSPTRIKQLVDWELVLATDYVYSTLSHLDNESWKSALPLLLDDFQQLLRDALDLLRELGEADDYSDRSYWHLPSITPHRKNRTFCKWVSLIELLRDAWLAVHASDKASATRIAQTWFELPYPTFKRLALFAASHDGGIKPQKWVEWLLADGAWWLWSINTKREVCRLFVLQGRYLNHVAQQKLEAAILLGPPRKMYYDDLAQAQWQNLVADSVWRRLAKLKTSGLILGTSASARLLELTTADPQLQLASNESDEFSHWMSGTGDPDYENNEPVDIAPRKRQALVQWLTKATPPPQHFYRDTWAHVCRKHLLNCLCALGDLAQKDVWPTDRWREALHTWGTEGMALRSWRYAAPLVLKMPDAVLQEIGDAVTWWIESASKSINRHQDILLKLCHRVLTLPLDAGSVFFTTKKGAETDDPVRSAINHPIGHVTQALINLWFKQRPNDNDLLPADIGAVFALLCDVKVDQFRHGRVLLGKHLVDFFRVDRPWTEKYLLPLFDWSNSVEAKAVWAGFLWSPRLGQSVLSAFKSQFLDTANHYAELGEHRQQFAIFLTYAALGPTDGYSAKEFRSAFQALQTEGLEASAQALYQLLESTVQRERYWKNRVLPFWQQIWPKSRDLATPRIAESLSRIAIAARGEFPEALSEVQHWLQQPLESPHNVVVLLYQSDLCSRFPAEALQLLNALINNKQWASSELSHCLDEIVRAAPALAKDDRLLKLRDYLR